MRNIRVAMVAATSVSLACAVAANACSTTYSAAALGDAGEDATLPAADASFDASIAVDGTPSTIDASSSDADAAVFTGDAAFTFLSPSDPSGTLVEPYAINWEIATDPPAVIRYTIGGTTLGASPASAMSPIEITKPEAGVYITWQVENDPTVHSFLVQIDAGMQAIASSVAYDFIFSKSGAPIVHATPNESLIVIVGTSTEWNESQAPTAIDQITYGYVGGDGGIGCVVDKEPGVYPGTTVANANLTIAAPATPGTYVVRLGFQREFKCTPDTIGEPLTGPVIGVVIVD